MSSKAFTRMTSVEVSEYREYIRRHRAKLPQDERTKNGNTAYARAQKQVRKDTERVEQAQNA